MFFSQEQLRREDEPRGLKKMKYKCSVFLFNPVFQCIRCPCRPKKLVAIIMYLVCREWGVTLGFEINYLCVNFTAWIKISSMAPDGEAYNEKLDT